MTDDKRLKQIESEYGSGRMLTGEAKAELVKVDAASLRVHVASAIAVMKVRSLLQTA